MVRIILKNGDILEYPDATIAKGIYDTNLIELKDEDEKQDLLYSISTTLLGGTIKTIL